MRLKRNHEKVVRTTISMPPVLLDFGLEAAKRNGYATFSAYLQAKLRAERDQANSKGQLQFA